MCFKAPITGIVERGVPLEIPLGPKPGVGTAAKVSLQCKEIMPEDCPSATPSALMYPAVLALGARVCVCACDLCLLGGASRSIGTASLCSVVGFVRDYLLNCCRGLRYHGGFLDFLG